MSRSRQPLLHWLIPAVLLIGIGWIPQNSSRPDPGASSTPSASPAPAETVSHGQLQSPKSTRREAKQHSAAESEPKQAAEAAPALQEAAQLVRGQTLDKNGQPVPFVDLVFERSDRLQAQSDGSGNFEFSLFEISHGKQLMASGKRHATLMGCRMSPTSVDVLQYVVVAPALHLKGRVLDPAGNGLSGVAINAGSWDFRGSSFPHPVDQGLHNFPRHTSDDSGAFDLKGVALLPGEKLSFSLAGYQQLALELPKFDQTELNIVLERDVLEGSISGRVRLPDGSPAVGAKVAFNGAETTTDSNGHFALHPSASKLHKRNQGVPLALAAALVPHGPAILEDFGSLLESERPNVPQNLELQLGPRALTIRGRVVDEEGLGQAGWQVMILDGLVLSAGHRPAFSAESLSGLSASATDNEGRFVLGGLLDREYELWAFESIHLQTIQPPSKIKAGEQELLLVVSAADLHGELRGQVLALDGSPLEGLSVSASMETAHSQFGSKRIASSSVRTDAEGRFVLRSIGHEGVSLSIGSDAVIPGIFPLDAQADPLDLRFELPRRCHFRLFIDGVGSEQQRVRFQDGEGQDLYTYSFQANGWSCGIVTPLNPLNPGVMAVSETAVAVLVGRESPQRHPVTLIPGQVTELRLQQ